MGENYLDTTFGNNGLVNYYLGETGGNCIVTSAITYPNGKILVSTFNGKFEEGFPTYTKSFLSKYNEDGSLDTTFGNKGTTEGNFGRGLQFFLNEDGSFFVLGIPPAFQGIPWTLSLYSEIGQLNTNFGKNGIIDSETLATEYGESLSSNSNFIFETSGGVDFQNKILLGGMNLLIGLFNKDGTVDTTFGNNGFSKPSSYQTDNNNYGYVQSLTLQNNKIITVNQYTTYIKENTIIDGEETTEIISTSYQYFLTRYNQDGSVDKSFGNNGTKTFIEKTEDNLYSYVKVQSNNKIIILTRNFKNPSFTITRFDENGNLDTTFGINGSTQIEYSNDENRILNLEITKTDYILVSIRTFLYQFTEDGQLDTNFGENGKIQTVLENNDVMTLYQDDKVLLSGNLNSNAGISRYNLGSNLKVNQNMMFEIWGFFIKNPGFGFNLPNYDISGMLNIDYGVHRTYTNELLDIMALYTNKRYKLPGLASTSVKANYNSGISSVNEFLGDENI